MSINKAVSIRITNLLKKYKMTAYQLSNKSFIPTSTLSNILNENNKSINLSTIYKLAYGFSMTVKEFLNDDVFDDTEILKELI